MTKTNTPAEVVDRVGSPLTLIITAPMLDTLEHGAYRFRRVEAENAGDATHLCLVLGAWCLANKSNRSYWSYVLFLLAQSSTLTLSRSESNIRNVVLVVDANSSNLIGASPDKTAAQTAAT